MCILQMGEDNMMEEQASQVYTAFYSQEAERV